MANDRVVCSYPGDISMSGVVGRIGRPTKDPVDGERVQLGTRVTAGVKRRLDMASVESGRSLSQETEMRLEQSFLPVMTLRDWFAGQMLAGAAPGYNWSLNTALVARCYQVADLMLAERIKDE